MKFNGRFWLLILAVGLVLGVCSSTAWAAGDTVAITVQKWTASFGALVGSSGPMVVDQDDAGVFAPDGFGSFIPTGDPDPFAGALDITVIFGLDSTSPGMAELDSNVDIKKDGTNDTTAYWIKVFVEKKNTSPASPGFPYPSGSPLSAETTYAQTTSVGGGGTMSSLIKDSVNTSGLGSASIPLGSPVTGSNSFTRTDATYDVIQEYDISLSTAKGAHVEVLMSTTVVPEPVTILSALIGLAPMALMVRSFRRRKSDI